MLPRRPGVAVTRVPGSATRPTATALGVSEGMALLRARGSGGMGRAELLFQHLPQSPASSQAPSCC